ncbi:hypothetical protein AB0H43_04445 [Hamadaea sp. NPDC050747]|uniref:hypothetical protein n=1 Tax=Hamadaea sp. NPDC050747 TaxID=3155789 RepID=UPI0033FF5D75
MTTPKPAPAASPMSSRRTALAWRDPAAAAMVAAVTSDGADDVRHRLDGRADRAGRPGHSVRRRVRGEDRDAQP